MITNKGIEDHLIVLRMNCDPESPFFGMVDMASDGGLLTLPIDDQKAVYEAMDAPLKSMVDTFMDEMRRRQAAASSVVRILNCLPEARKL
jgi:hypothetical protein